MIWSNDIQATDAIRSGKVLEAREAIARGAMDTPERLDAAVDLMIHRERLDEAMHNIVLEDIAKWQRCGFWMDYED